MYFYIGGDLKSAEAERRANVSLSDILRFDDISNARPPSPNLEAVAAIIDMHMMMHISKAQGTQSKWFAFVGPNEEGSSTCFYTLSAFDELHALYACAQEFTMEPSCYQLPIRNFLGAIYESWIEGADEGQVDIGAIVDVFRTFDLGPYEIISWTNHELPVCEFISKSATLSVTSTRGHPDVRST
jgi:hypothetical protein